MRYTTQDGNCGANTYRENKRIQHRVVEQLKMRKNKIKFYIHTNILLSELASDKDSPHHPFPSLSPPPLCLGAFHIMPSISFSEFLPEI
jgi:hypothetical protein